MNDRNQGQEESQYQTTPKHQISRNPQCCTELWLIQSQVLPCLTDCLKIQ